MQASHALLPRPPLSIKCPPPHRRSPLQPSSTHPASTLEQQPMDWDPYFREGGPVQILSEGLYISSRTYAESPSMLHKLNVGIVINVASEVVNALLETSQDASGRLANPGCLVPERIRTPDESNNIPNAIETWSTSSRRADTAWLQIMSPCGTPSLSPSASSTSDSLDFSHVSSSSSAALPSPSTQKPEKSPSLNSPSCCPDMSSHPLPDYLKINWDHSADITLELPEMLDVIDFYLGISPHRDSNDTSTPPSKRKSVLVACNQGVSRSASLVIACVMKRRRLPMIEAYAFVKARSHCISPHVGLLGQLAEFEAKLVY
ncbi:protein-tyrosine phosphatase-like protein [Chytriomyces cf. hyalinus JEL632]|nr:protein-tyrosine phosphatase-like protein [Chytriomyces cf. hyalinus JEL632]